MPGFPGQGANLKGFCSAEEASYLRGGPGLQEPNCQAGASYQPPPPNPCAPGEYMAPCAPSDTIDPVTGCCVPVVTYNMLDSSPYRPQVQALLGNVKQSLLNVAAAVGNQVLCPLLPTLGRALGTAIADWIAYEELTLTLGTGVVVGISISEAGLIIGGEAGIELQRVLCPFGSP
jgi:hypothetical protein